MKRRVLLLGVETGITPDDFQRLKTVLEEDFPEHTVRLVAGLRYAADFSVDTNRPREIRPIGGYV